MAAAQDGSVLLTGLPLGTVVGAGQAVAANSSTGDAASATPQTPGPAAGPTPAQSSGTNANPQAGPNLQTGLSLNLDIVATQLNQLRINIEPRIGASTYTLTPAAIQNLPGGKNTPINNTILQMPGVDQDNLANGGLHIRMST